MSDAKLNRFERALLRLLPDGYEGEHRLWVAVIKQAVKDADTEGPRRKNELAEKLEREDAKRYLLGPGMKAHAQMIGLNPEIVLEYAKSVAGVEL